MSGQLPAHTQTGTQQLRMPVGGVRDDVQMAAMLWCCLPVMPTSISLARTQPLLDPFFEAYRTVKTFKDDPSIEVGSQAVGAPLRRVPSGS